MQISLNGTAFTSYDVKAKGNSKNETFFEETLQNQQSYQTNIQLSPTSVNTTFKDPTNDKLVTISLENSTIEKLQNQFGKDSVLKDENGNISLTGKAQDFVAGWFADIAYTRDFLKADVNNDGVLSEEEYGKTKNGLGISSSIRFEQDDFVVKEEALGYFKTNNIIYSSEGLNYNAYRTGKNESSIDDELNYTLNLDKDFNGNITLQETYEGESSIEQKVQENLKKLFLDNKDSFIYNISYGEKYFTQALNYVLETMEKSETLDKDKWEQIRKDNYLKLDKGYLQLDLEVISTLDSTLIEKLLKKLKGNNFSVEQNNLKTSETTENFLNRINTKNKEIEIYV